MSSVNFSRFYSNLSYSTANGQEGHRTTRLWTAYQRTRLGLLREEYGEA